LERAIQVIIRAGSPDWYGRSIRNRKIAGSNPAQSTHILRWIYSEFSNTIFDPRSQNEVDLNADIMIYGTKFETKNTKTI
jgi:hypothetical protein